MNILDKIKREQAQYKKLWKTQPHNLATKIKLEHKRIKINALRKAANDMLKLPGGAARVKKEKPCILYVITDSNHDRVFRSFQEDPRVEQIICVHDSVSRSGYNLRTTIHGGKQSFKAVFDAFCPDVVVQTSDTKTLRRYVKSYGAKHVFMAHGMYSRSPNVVGMANNGFWAGFDLFCGMTNNNADLFSDHMVVESNTLTQLDELYKYVGDENVRDEILSKSMTNAEKMILVFGHDMKYRHCLDPYHEDYYRSVIELAHLAEQYNWYVCIKVKGNRDVQHIDWLIENGNEWASEIKAEYLSAINNRHIRRLAEGANQYQYMAAADAIVVSARSTTETEAVLADKPLVRLCSTRTELTEQYEFGILDADVAYVVEDVGDLHKTMLDALNNKHDFSDNRKAFLETLGLTLDGRAYERALNAMIDLLELKDG